MVSPVDDHIETETCFRYNSNDEQKQNKFLYISMSYRILFYTQNILAK
jgi:hypothetical protein